MSEHDDKSESGLDSPKNIEAVIRDDGRYSPEAFNFLHEGLGQAVEKTHGNKAVPNGHVSGQALCESLRDLARERYGLLAPAVLRRWGVNESIDFGKMVYLLIDHGLMRKTDEDSIEDFRDNFDLDKDFDTTADIKLRED